MHYSNAYGGNQTVNVIELDGSAGWDLQPHLHNGCFDLENIAPTLNAIAGINGSFFNSSCQPLNMVKADGTLHSTNTLHSSQGTAYQQRSMGWNQGAPTLSWIDQNVDWSGVSNAIGGYPSLVNNGTAFAEIYPGEQVWSSTDWSDNPEPVWV